jgi:serine/threonine protein kinase
MQSQESGTLLQGRYELQAVIGRDTMGRIYVASDNRFPGRFVTLVEREVGDATAAQRLRYQARTLAALPRHPAIPAVTDTFSDDGRIYVVMDYVAGPTLGELWRRHGLPFAETQVLSWGLVLADALAHLHAQQPPVIHGAFGLESVAVRQDGAPALRDFGLACPELALTQASVPECLAPEREHGVVGAPSDVYGLAATLYTLLTGELPPAANVRVQGMQPLPPLRTLNPHISLATAASIESALTLLPAERPTMREFHQRLREALLAQQRAAGLAPTDDLGTHPLGSVPDETFALTSPPATSAVVPRRLPRWLMLIVVLVICLVLSASAGAIALPLFMGHKAPYRQQQTHPTLQMVPESTGTGAPHRRSIAPDPTPTSPDGMAAPAASTATVVPTAPLAPGTVQSCIQPATVYVSTSAPVATGKGNPPPMAYIGLAVTNVIRCPDHIELDVVEYSINFSGNWGPWIAVAGQSVLLDNQGGQYAASVQQSQPNTQQTRVRPGGMRSGRLWFPVAALPAGDTTLTLQFAADPYFMPNIITLSGIPVPEPGQGQSVNEQPTPGPLPHHDQQDRDQGDH